MIASRPCQRYSLQGPKPQAAGPSTNSSTVSWGARAREVCSRSHLHDTAELQTGERGYAVHVARRTSWMDRFRWATSWREGGRRWTAGCRAELALKGPRSSRKIKKFAVASDCGLDDEQGILPMHVRLGQDKMRKSDRENQGWADLGKPAAAW